MGGGEAEPKEALWAAGRQQEGALGGMVEEGGWEGRGAMPRARVGLRALPGRQGLEGQWGHRPSQVHLGSLPRPLYKDEHLSLAQFPTSFVSPRWPRLLPHLLRLQAVY